MDEAAAVLSAAYQQPGVSHEWARALGYQDALMVLGVLFVIAAVPAWKMRPHG
jgi:hypothetical protein